MPHYLDPKNDLTFKRVFGEHPDLLISFLNALMPFEQGRYIQEIEYLQAEQVPDNPAKKNSIVDVKCKDNYERQFIVEMQVFWTEAFYNRIVFNAGKAYVRQLDSGKEYHLLQPVYTLSILNQNFDHKTKQFYHHYQIANCENTDEIIPGLEFVLVELPKFHPETISERKLAVLWLRFLKEVNENMRTLPIEMQENEYIRKAAQICEIGAFTPEELDIYDRYWDSIRVEKTLRIGAFQEGEAEGLKKGEAKGLKEGEAKGLKKGEAKTLKRIVVNAKDNGFSLEQIQLLTKLSAEQINEILKQETLIIKQ
jgi:predicted transposase/invertase (TIGR01784 family)